MDRPTCTIQKKHRKHAASLYQLHKTNISVRPVTVNDPVESLEDLRPA